MNTKLLSATLASIVVAIFCGCSASVRTATAKDGMASMIIGNQHKSRLIVTTDLGGSDPDDIQSMIHLLVCSDRFDIEGLISAQAWVNDPDKTPALKTVVDKFLEVLPNLNAHSCGYPSADHLRSIIVRGQTLAHVDGIGEGKDSEGSELIVKAVTNDDERPIWLTAWGGMNTIAQALGKLQRTLDTEQFNRCISKIRIYDILGQDDAGAYIAKNYPDVVYIRNTQIYGWAPDDEWTRENVQSRLPLGAAYPDRIWATEGDSPAFLYAYANGLNVPEHPEYGGWGGRFSLDKTKNIRGMDFIERSGKSEAVYDDYYMTGSASEGVRAIKRWENHIYNDFAARMIWAQTDRYVDANHHPVVVVNGVDGLAPLMLYANPGEIVRLSAAGSFDPDADDLNYSWQIYLEPSVHGDGARISSGDEQECEVVMPNIANACIHVILEVTDNGSPQLTSYRRIIIGNASTGCSRR